MRECGADASVEEVTRATLFWRRVDVEALEQVQIASDKDGLDVNGTVLTPERGGLLIRHSWRLDPAWRTISADIERSGPAGTSRLRLERDGAGWRVDGSARIDLDGAEEPDLSVTPFCNSLPIRRMSRAGEDERTFDVAFIDGLDLSVQRSRQRYQRLGRRRWRYIDLGTAKGFEADLSVDHAGLVVRYQHLFERIGSQSPE